MSPSLRLSQWPLHRIAVYSTHSHVPGNEDVSKITQQRSCQKMLPYPPLPNNSTLPRYIKRSHNASRHPMLAFSWSLLFSQTCLPPTLLLMCCFIIKYGQPCLVEAAQTDSVTTQLTTICTVSQISHRLLIINPPYIVVISLGGGCRIFVDIT